MGIVLFFPFIAAWFLMPVIVALKNGISHKKLFLVIVLDLLSIVTFILTWIPSLLIANSKGIYEYSETRQKIVKFLTYLMRTLFIVIALWVIYGLIEYFQTPN